MSESIAKKLLFGQDFTFHGAADIFHLFNDWKTSISPESFNPLIGVTGGMSLVAVSGDDPSTRALLFGGDWVRKCRSVGATTKNSLICLASNFDDSIGLAALTLEFALIAKKERTAESLRIDLDTYLEIVHEIFIKDYAGVLSMAEKWNVRVVEWVEGSSKRTRSTWREELGHDVLIHPVTLEPCKHADGSTMMFNGTIHKMDEDRCYFSFTHSATGEEILMPDFPVITNS